MNILHHKSWHVRTKENIRRVRKDEAKAAEDERRELERQLNVQNERRLSALRNQAQERMDNFYGSKSGTTDTPDEPSSSTHINFFEDLEREERKNLGSGNDDYKKDKEKEKEEWETKMGILVKLAQDTNELSKKKEWYETLPRRKTTLSKPERLVYPTSSEKSASQCLPEEKAPKRKREKSEKKDKKKKKKKKRAKHADSDESDREEKRDEKDSKSSKLAELREERLRREREEKERSWRVMHPELAKQQDKEKERQKPKYNSGFNPHLSRK
ncbi:unnamed protein product, partial [Mesorhabditis belari]|uniref:CBF1-interacting co-repressor CIR N-terminal domain-containing protein n=1 Tax=Mesorhabditis belari TaxID=2138241 RepID=A0AAF3J1P4_9BILA